MWRGWHYLPGGPTDDRPPMDAATCLDSAIDDAVRSPEVLVRPYFTGRPDPSALGDLLWQPLYRGRRVQLANEPNHPNEGFGGGPADYAAWFLAVADAAPPDARLYYGAVSPGFPGWLTYYTDPACAAAIDRAAGLCVHAYGDRDQMLTIVQQVAGAWPGKPLWIGECNFGAGQACDVDAWATANLRPFLDDCALIPAVEAVCYFAYVWATPDMTLPTPVDGRGTAVETVLHDWRPPPNGGAEVPDIVLNVPMRTSMAAPENYGPGPRAHTIGVTIHTTRGGTSTVENEYTATINWFQNPTAAVSAHLIVGGGAFPEVCRSVHDDDVAWHCREANATHLGIEIAQALPTSPISDFQYVAAADACRKWAARYHFPLTRVMSQNTPGLVGHQDTEAGRRDGKTDPGVPPTGVFDWDRFIKLCTGGSMPTDPTALRDKTWALADQLQKLGVDWRQAGYPHHASYVENQGEAIKDTVAISKQEK